MEPCKTSIRTPWLPESKWAAPPTNHGSQIQIAQGKTEEILASVECQQALEFDLTSSSVGNAGRVLGGGAFHTSVSARRWRVEHQQTVQGRRNCATQCCKRRELHDVADDNRDSPRGQVFRFLEDVSTTKVRNADTVIADRQLRAHHGCSIDVLGAARKAGKDTALGVPPHYPTQHGCR